MKPAASPRIAKLSRAHQIDAFDCGIEALDTFLKRHALANQSAGGAQTYVAEIGDAVAGYFSLTVGSVEHDGAAARLSKGLARHPIPVMILARLAVDRNWKGEGLGAALLKDALIRTARAADIAGLRAIVVHAKDEQARRFYRHFDFDEASSDPFHLFLLMKQVRRLIRGEPA